MKSEVKTRLSEQIEQAIAYLARQVQQESAYDELIDSLNWAAEKSRTADKPIVKLLLCQS